MLFWLKWDQESGRRLVCSRKDRKLLVRPAVSDRRQFIYHIPQRSSRGSCWALVVGIPSFPARDSIICLFTEHNCVIVAAIRPQQRPYDVASTRRLPKQCRNNGIGACATQCAVHHCAVNAKGVPAKPQYPLRGSAGGDPLLGSDGGGSLVSHRHIMQPDPWHRKKFPPHLMMQPREKYSIQHVSKAGRAARIGAIIRKWPGFPAKPDHGAPLLHDCVLFGQEHATSPSTAYVDASAGSAATTSKRSRRRFSPMRFVTSDKSPPKPVIRGTKVRPALNVPTNALKNARIRRPFSGNATMICGGRRGRKQRS